MTVREFKIRYLRSKINPILFYLPVKNKKDSPFIYKIQGDYAKINFNDSKTYRKYIIDDESSNGYKIDNSIDPILTKLNLKIDWGDGSTSIITGEQKENIDNLIIKIDSVITTLCEHQYSRNGEYEISISGYSSYVFTVYDPIEIIQWGNLHFEYCSNSFIQQTIPKFLKIPEDKILTGWSDVQMMDGWGAIFNQCIIDVIPNNFLTELKELLFINSIMNLYIDSDATKDIILQHPLSIKNNICKGLKKLTQVYYLVYTPYLKEIGDSIFEECGISSITGLRGGGHNLSNENILYPIVYSTGKNLFKNCKKLKKIDSSFQTWHDNSSYYSDDLNTYYLQYQTLIGDSMFENCEKLEDLSYFFAFSYLSNIPKNTFKGCTSLKKLSNTFASMRNPLYLEENLFSDLTALEDISDIFFETLILSSPKFTNSPLKNASRACCNTLHDIRLTNYKVYYRGYELPIQIPDLDITNIFNIDICSLDFHCENMTRDTAYLNYINGDYEKTSVITWEYDEENNSLKVVTIEVGKFYKYRWKGTAPKIPDQYVHNFSSDNPFHQAYAGCLDISNIESVAARPTAVFDTGLPHGYLNDSELADFCLSNFTIKQELQTDGSVNFSEFYL